ncbi:hypothetical protein LTR37_018283 [Vermiconidia calcicola]|uniref:Uncharacterized protein n=1 Tax=Vermiconidia calcicola TaxID=1690605 RepID=A0ACC3MHT2_9PEZI|nr:hypothetical protein LTR37_018283 [Vermiconidia calcicola]
MSAIDPGVDAGIKESANDVEDDISDGEHAKQEQQDLMQPSHWWFASTACPLLAGTFGPMASGFNICALVHEWRQTIPPGQYATEGEGHVIPDPKWMIAINAVSLVSALIGNAALLLNMARRIKFALAQTITISGFLLAGVLLIADMLALTTQPHYAIKVPELMDPQRHALTQAFYYAIFAAVIYIILGLLMFVTVLGALKGHYERDFHLTPSQRTLMLQTMAFIAYLLLGAVVYSHIEGWMYLDAVYWANVTLLTVGLGDFHPSTPVGRGLLFPFAIVGIVMVGLVVGSIRSLILERGKEKLAARIVEKHRSKAVHNVDNRKQTVKISMFASADFSTDPGLSPAQKREEEFNVMRKVQAAAENERRWFALALSSSFVMVLWFVGAVVFMRGEFERHWTYLESLYFAFTSLLTIGYGDFTPASNSGKAFFVFWSLLAVPSLTILISNMGDTIIKWFSDLTNWIGSITVLPDESGLRASLRSAVQAFRNWAQDSAKSFTPPGVFGARQIAYEKRTDSREYDKQMLDRLAERLASHLGEDDLKQSSEKNLEGNELERDIRFYHYVLARECRNLQKDLSASPPKNYEWHEWEYYLKLMDNEEDRQDFPGQKHPDLMVPSSLQAPNGIVSSDALHSWHADRDGTVQKSDDDDKERSSSGEQTGKHIPNMDGNVDRQASVLQHRYPHWNKARNRRLKGPDADQGNSRNWSWLSNESPLMSQKPEAEWILERLSIALERELNRQRKSHSNKPPISLKDARKRKGELDGNSNAEKEHAGVNVREREQRDLASCAKSEQ